MSRLFAKITELVEEPDVLVFVLIDEVESLTSARKVREGREGARRAGGGGVRQPGEREGRRVSGCAPTCVTAGTYGGAGM